MAIVAERPWEALDPSVAETLRPELPRLAEEIIEAISAGVPDYRRPLEGSFGVALRAGVEEALRHFAELVEGARRSARGTVYANLGRGEMRAGRGLDSLQAAYRIGARVAWRRLARAGTHAGLEPEALYTLAESIFAYIDELSSESVEGYAREQAAAAGERQRRRRRLAELLVQEPRADPAAVEDAAAAAGWRLPAAVVAVAAGPDPGGELGDRIARRAAPDWLVATLPEAVCVLVPDPAAPARGDGLLAAFEGLGAAIGPPVSWREVRVSFARAAATLRLREEGLLAGSAPLRADEHSVELLLHADRRLGRDLAARALAPLEGMTGAARERYSETLAAWLAHQGRTERVASALHVHPQTVRYRLGRLRELFGERLERPGARFELELALRVAASGR